VWSDRQFRGAQPIPPYIVFGTRERSANSYGFSSRFILRTKCLMCFFLYFSPFLLFESQGKAFLFVSRCEPFHRAVVVVCTFLFRLPSCWFSFPLLRSVSPRQFTAPTTFYFDTVQQSVRHSRKLSRPQLALLLLTPLLCWHGSPLFSLR